MNLIIYLESEYHQLLENIPDNMEVKDISEYFNSSEEDTEAKVQNIKE